MKEILPVVIIIVISIVSSLLKRKDQDGPAKKHKPRNVKPVVVPANRSTPKPPPILVEERTDPFNPYEDRYERSYAEPKYRPMQAEPVKPERPSRVDYDFVERDWEEDIAEEVANNRVIHTPHNHKEFRVEHAEEKHAFQFDMQNAIIQEAILNRPKY